MKKVHFLLTVTFIFIHSITIHSQDEQPVLLPELDNRYIYETVYKEYIPNETGEKYTDKISRKKLQIDYKPMLPDTRKLLLVSVIENEVLRPDFNPVQYVDYRYPHFRDGFTKYTNDTYFQELLSTVVFQYELDVKKKEVKLHNRGDVLLRVRETLINKGFDKKGIERHTESFNTKGIPEISRYLQKIFFASDDLFIAEGGNQSFFNRKTNQQDSLIIVLHDKKDETPGLKHFEYIYNSREQVLYEFKEIRIDTLKWPATVFNKRVNQFFTEETLQLVSRQQIPETKLTVAGVIENVRNKKVTVGILREPFGTELHIETALLDENNAFEIETDFAHAGMVHLQFGQATDARNLPMLMFYAEPGNRIHVKIDGSAYPENVEYSGDNSTEAKAIHEFRSKYGLSFGSFNFNTIYAFPDASKYNDFYNALSNLEPFMNKLTGKVDSHTLKFINDEIKAQLLGMAFYFLKYKENWMPMAFNRPDDPDREKIDAEFIKRHINKYEIYNSYNNYGIHSRMLAGEMLDYYFTTSRKVSPLRSAHTIGYAIAYSEYRYIEDLPHQVEVARTILAGYPLYSQLAGLLQHEKMRISNNIAERGNYENSEIEKYLELMLRLVNDPEFTGSINRMMNNYHLWQKEDYVPEVEFLNLKGEKVQLQDFLGQKLTIFYVTQEWGTERYLWDDMAKKNPNMNLVLVMEGSNFDEWTDYIKRAEPVAHQLFLVTESLKIKDIFKSDTRHFIAYGKDGYRIGFATNPINAVNLVKQSLMDEKEEPDKSQLIFFIIILAGLFICSLLVLVIWKWRVRQRFRKEQQQRRLRELELTAIRSQMNPHFLFNCLNSVQNLVQQNKGREAHSYLAEFAGLIRKVLNNSEKEEVSLAEELDMVQQYLNLEKLRFDFSYQLKVNDDVDIYTTSVPSMLLQPFAENAITHGLQNKQGNRHLLINVLKEIDARNPKNTGKGILISIEDNGIGRLAAQKTEVIKNGKGTRLMEERLAILQQKHNEKYWLQTTDLNHNGTTGTKVEIFVPEEN